MAPLLAAVTTLALAVSPKQRPANELRAEYEASASRCRHGHNDGVIVHLHEDSEEPEDYLETLRARSLSGDVMRRHYAHTLRGVAAKLSKGSLERVFNDTHTVAVGADCIFYMNKIERNLLGSRTGASFRGAASLLTDQQNVDAMVSSGVEVRGQNGEAKFWNWGPDRSDSVRGTDDKYEFGRATGKGTVLYTIDTGVYTEHEDFGDRVVEGYSIGCPTGSEAECGGQWLYKGFITDAVRENSQFKSDGGEACDSHGTHTASTAAGRLYGVAKEAEIVVVQGLDCNGTASNSMFIAALDWAVGDAKRRGKPAVMTMSLGGERDEGLDKAAQRAVAHGYTVVTASGNDGGDSCQMSPGADPAAISVAAIDQRDRLAAYSNRGACTTLIAPGSSIVAAYIGSDKTGAAALSGTSMATPHVAGAVLQMLQKHPHYRPADVKRGLLCMATKGVVRDLDGKTPDRLLHTGRTLDLEHNEAILNKLETAEGAVSTTTVPAECDAINAVAAESKTLAAQSTTPAAGALQPAA